MALALFGRWLRREGFDDSLHSPLAMSPGDGHPSPFAHRIAAERLHDHLLRAGLLDQGAQLTPRHLGG